VLVVLLSAITWIPGLLLFLLQAYLEGGGWLTSNLRIAVAIVVASWVWILMLSLLALAVSATVKWKPVAAAALVAVFFVLAGLGSTLNAALGTQWGFLLNLALMIETVWAKLFGVPFPSLIPVGAAWASLLTVTALSLLMLSRKLRAYEVVR
jgi:ABC-2 type transport system permease protein